MRSNVPFVIEVHTLLVDEYWWMKNETSPYGWHDDEGLGFGALLSHIWGFAPTCIGLETTIGTCMFIETTMFMMHYVHELMHFFRLGFG